jgi:hypothetical protein
LFLHLPPDDESCFSRPDSGPIEAGFQRTQQVGFMLERRRFVGAKLKFNPGHFTNHPQLTPRHSVGIRNSIVLQAPPKIFCLADIQHSVRRVPHQINARLFSPDIS